MAMANSSFFSIGRLFIAVFFFVLGFLTPVLLRRPETLNKEKQHTVTRFTSEIADTNARAATNNDNLFVGVQEL